MAPDYVIHSGGRVIHGRQAFKDWVAEFFWQMPGAEDEILADTLVSLPACTAYVRHRDIRDLHWLRRQGAHSDAEMIRRKVRDYGVDDYPALVSGLISRLHAIVHGKEFRDQMLRFIPQEVQERTLLKDKFLGMLEQETGELLRSAIGISAN